MATRFTGGLSVKRLVAKNRGQIEANAPPADLSGVDPASVADPAPVLVPQRIAVGPVHEPAQIVPLVQATNLHAVAHAERHALREV